MNIVTPVKTTLAMKISNTAKPLCILVALLAMVLVIAIPTPDSLDPVGQRVIALFIGAIILWATEAIPIAVTSLLVLVLQPLFGVADLGVAITNFMTPVFFFILAMFIIAYAWVRTGLARRFAWWMLSRAGTDSRRVIYVFVIGTGIISTIMSDISAAAIFMAIALGIFANRGIEPNSRFGRAIMLGIPIGALIGGVGTPAGSSINLLGLEIIAQHGGEGISFIAWMALGIPMIAILLPLSAWVLIRFFPPEIDNIGDIDDIHEERRQMGRMTSQEVKLSSITAIMVVLWILSSWPSIYPDFLTPLANLFLIGIAGSILMFLPGVNLFTWKDVQPHIGWDALLLIGAVTSLGALSHSSGLAEWLVGTFLSDMATWSILTILMVISVITVLIHLLLPINPVIPLVMVPPLMVLAEAAGANPLLFTLPVVFTASCAFLLPLDAVALVTYGKGYYRMYDMFPPGVLISIAWVVVMTSSLYVIGPLIGIL